MNDRFLWKEGDIILEKEELPITETQKKKAEKAINEVIEEFKRLKEKEKTCGKTMQ